MNDPSEQRTVHRKILDAFTARQDHPCPISKRLQQKILASYWRRNQFQDIEIGMFQGIEPLSLLFGNMFGDHVSQLLDEGQLSVFGIVVAKEIEARQLYFLLQRRDKPSCVSLNIWLQDARQRSLSLHTKLRPER